MAEVKNNLEREYIIPLRKEWMKVSRHKRARRSVMEIKAFIARHMKVLNRDLDKVKLDSYLNNELWFRGAKKPPVKIKVKARKEGEIVRVELAEPPEIVKYTKVKNEKKHKKNDKKKTEVKTEDKKEEKSEEEKKKEEEKEKSVEQMHEKLAERATNVQKHTTKAKEESFHRMALKK